MATTKTKESSSLVKEKKGTSPSISQTNSGKKIIKQSKPGGALNANDTSTRQKKPLPNYLKPTVSSNHDPSSHKPNPIRRRSFDKPPSASSRVQNPHISPGPRARVPIKSLTSAARTSTASKPHQEKPIKTSSKDTKVQPLKKTTKKGLTTAWVPRKEVAHPSPGSTQTSPPKSETNEEEIKESFVHEFEKEVEVAKSNIDDPDEVVQSDNPNQEVDIADEQQNITITNAAVQLDESKIENQEKEEKGSAVDEGADIIPENQEEKENSCPETENEDKLKPDVVECDDDQAKIEEGKQEDGVVVEGQQPEASDVLSKRSVGQKKDSPAYNDVIEETASKLMEKRQNKVLALAGAFQSVIDTETSSSK